MEFRLTYEGTLLASTARNAEKRLGGTRHKHDLRRAFHLQLRHFWSQHKWLSNAKYDGVPLWEHFSKDYHEFGYRFVPLVRERDSLLCSINILFLRRDIPGGVIRSGDLDNRIKIVFDALRRPRNASELVGNEKPLPDEDPFFVLLEDDSLISHASVETDMLTEPPADGDNDVNKVRLIITVRIKPYAVGLFNLSFA